MWWSLTRVACLSFVIDALARHMTWFSPWAALATAIVLIVETHRALDRAVEPASHFGLTWFAVGDDPDAQRATLGRAAREWLLGTAAALLVAIPYIFGATYVLGAQIGDLKFSPAALATPFVHHTLVVALPEEAYFRGIVQTRLAERLRAGATRRALAHPAVLAGQAMLFALVHLTTAPEPIRLLVAFPAVLFGLLRAARRDIVAAVAMHATFNVAGLVLSSALR